MAASRPHLPGCKMAAARRRRVRSGGEGAATPPTPSFPHKAGGERSGGRRYTHTHTPLESAPEAQQVGSGQSRSSSRPEPALPPRRKGKGRKET